MKKQNRKDRVDESLGSFGLGRTEFANMPQRMVSEDFPRNPSIRNGLSDGLAEVDRQISADVNAANRYMKNIKY